MEPPENLFFSFTEMVSPAILELKSQRKEQDQAHTNYDNVAEEGGLTEQGCPLPLWGQEQKRPA